MPAASTTPSLHWGPHWDSIWAPHLYYTPFLGTATAHVLPKQLAVNKQGAENEMTDLLKIYRMHQLKIGF